MADEATLRFVIDARDQSAEALARATAALGGVDKAVKTVEKTNRTFHASERQVENAIRSASFSFSAMASQGLSAGNAMGTTATAVSFLGNAFGTLGGPVSLAILAIANVTEGVIRYFQHTSQAKKSTDDLSKSVTGFEAALRVLGTTHDTTSAKIVSGLLAQANALRDAQTIRASIHAQEQTGLSISEEIVKTGEKLTAVRDELLRLDKGLLLVNKPLSEVRAELVSREEALIAKSERLTAVRDKEADKTLALKKALEDLQKATKEKDPIDLGTWMEGMTEMQFALGGIQVAFAETSAKSNAALALEGRNWANLTGIVKSEAEIQMLAKRLIADEGIKEAKREAAARRAAAVQQIEMSSQIVAAVGELVAKDAATKKAFLVMEVAMQTAANIVKVFPNVPLMIGAGVLGALQAATILAARPGSTPEGGAPSVGGGGTFDTGPVTGFATGSRVGGGTGGGTAGGGGGNVTYLYVSVIDEEMLGRLVDRLAARGAIRPPGGIPRGDFTNRTQRI